MGRFYKASMIKENELLEDINSYIEQYRSELAKQQAKSILDNQFL